MRTLTAALLFAALTAFAQQPQQPTTPPRDPAEGPSATATKVTSAPPAAAAVAPQAASVFDTKPLRWRAIGPANMGGRIADFAVNEKDPYTIFAAVGTGGVLRTTNNGTTWQPVFDKEPVASTGSVAVSQNNPKIVWVGTGEGNSRNSSSWGNGIYKSSDGGDSWTNMGLPDSGDIPHIALDPKSDDVAYAAVLGHLWGLNKERGVYKTSDGGKSWQQVFSIDENTGAIDVMVDPSMPSTVYAAMWTRRRFPWGFNDGGPNSGIWKSIDAGKTWKRLTDGLPAETGRIGLDIYRKNPKTLYAVIESDIGGSAGLETIRSRSGGIFRSDDSGAHWKRVSDLAPRGFYFAKVRVDPNNDQRVYVLGFGTAVSDDGGRTFLNTGARDIHGDCHAMWIDPNNSNHVLLGTDGGIYFSYDKTKSWDFQNNIPLGEFYNVSYGMDKPYTLCGGLQDNGTWCGPSQTIWSTANDEDDKKKAAGIWNADWKFVNDGDGFWSAIDPANPNIIYAESQGGYIARIDLTNGKRRDIKPRAKEGTTAFRYNWNAPFVISHFDPKTLYLGGNVLFRLTNRGDNWEQISPDLSQRDVAKIMTAGSNAETYGTIVALSESPKDRNVIWAGTDDGNVQVTRDGGKSWTNVTGNIPGVPPGLWVSRLQASNFDAARAYVTIDGHRSDDFHAYVFATDDYGKTWRPITNELKDPLKAFREDPANQELLFAGTEFGIFMSQDRGAHWQSIKGDLPTVSVDDIEVHPRDHDLIIATHGRSIYVMDDISGLEQLTPAKSANNAVLFDPRPVTEHYYNPTGGLWGAHVFKAKNPPYGAYINYWLKGTPAEDVTITIEDAKGNKVRELDATNRAGLNRAVWDLHGDPHEVISDSRGEDDGSPYVAPGEYTVKMKYGDFKAQTKLTVEALPGVHEGEFVAP
ncbi:MAG TPA: hypothetical protein VJ901_21725 [Thermoanaerobaculia bacterium]|nr:hypothetical protein [Thermoanaerobaculia bacterium]